MKIVVTGGGTGGHIFPALAVAEELRRCGHWVTWIGSRRGMEAEIVPTYDFMFRGIFTGKLRRYFDWQNFFDFFKIIYGFIQTRHFLQKIKPDIVFSKGGFVSVPVALAARTLRIPVVTHESDVTPGLATRLIVRFGRAKVCAGWESLFRYFPDREVIVTGTPVRDTFFRIDPVAVRARLRMTRDELLIVIIGGSQGALGLNRFLWPVLSKVLTRARVIHQTGEVSLLKAQQVKADLVQDLGSRYSVQASWPNEKMAELLSAADLVISRGGATSLAELAAVGAATILIPLPTSSSRGDQLDNAHFLQEQGAAIICEQDRIDAQGLERGILQLLDDSKKRRELSRQMRNLAQPEAVRKIVEVIEKSASSG